MCQLPLVVTGRIESWTLLLPHPGLMSSRDHHNNNPEPGYPSTNDAASNDSNGNGSDNSNDLMRSRTYTYALDPASNRLIPSRSNSLSNPAPPDSANTQDEPALSPG